MAFLDPPYNVSIKGVVGRGRRKHGEFAMASGEMSRGEFVSFLTETLAMPQLIPAREQFTMSAWTGDTLAS